MNKRFQLSKAIKWNRIFGVALRIFAAAYFGFLLLGPYLLRDRPKLIIKLNGELPARFVVTGFGTSSWLPEVECILRVKDGTGRFERGSLEQMHYYGYIPTYLTKSARQVEVIRYGDDGREIERVQTGSQGVVITGMEDSPIGTPQVYFVKKLSGH